MKYMLLAMWSLALLMLLALGQFINAFKEMIWVLTHV